jgi:hypothetical protein
LDAAVDLGAPSIKELRERLEESFLACEHFRTCLVGKLVHESDSDTLSWERGLLRFHCQSDSCVASDPREVSLATSPRHLGECPESTPVLLAGLDLFARKEEISALVNTSSSCVSPAVRTGSPPRPASPSRTVPHRLRGKQGLPDQFGSPTRMSIGRSTLPTRPISAPSPWRSTQQSHNPKRPPVLSTTGRPTSARRAPNVKELERVLAEPSARIPVLARRRGPSIEALQQALSERASRKHS